MNEFNEITKNPLVIFVVSLIISTLLGLLSSFVLFKSFKSTASFKYRGAALTGAAAFFIIFYLLICYYFIPILMKKSEKEKLLPLITPTGYVDYSQPEFAIALPTYVNQNNIVAMKMLVIPVMKIADMNTPVATKDVKFIFMFTIQFSNKEDLNLEEFSKDAIANSKEKITSFSSDPNMSFNIVSNEYTPIFGTNGITTTYEIKTLDKDSGELTTIQFKSRAFADEKNLRMFAITSTVDEDTEKVLSTLRISS